MTQCQSCTAEATLFVESKSLCRLAESDVAGGATNTVRPLTHSLDQTKEGLAVDATREQEEWRPVVGFEGFIEVSSLGRLRSLDRMTYVSASRTAPAYWRRHKGKILEPAPHPRGGYKYIKLSGGGKIRNNAKVHHLVLEAFVGPRPPGTECCHANDIAGDNRVENLRWDTPAANAEDRRGRYVKTHCPQGHEYTPENTMIVKVSSQKVQRCKICTRRYQAGLSEAKRLRRESDPEYAEQLRRKWREEKRRETERKRRRSA